MRRILAAWSRRPRLTRNGLYVLTLTVMASQVAFVTGNNTFWFLCAAGLSLLLSNAFLGWRGLRRLTVRRVLPQTAFAGEPFAGSYQVSNSGRLPAFFVIFEDLPVPPRIPDGELRPIFAFAAAIPARQSATVPFSVRLSMRGWNRFKSVRISSDFPFGFFRVAREINLSDEMLVYPRAGRVLQPLPVERSADGSVFAQSLRPQPGEDDFAGLQEWRPGGNPKAIHWPSFGRFPDRILAREYERARVPRACLLVDTQSASDRRFEQIVSFAAANLLDLHKNGVGSALWTGRGDAVTSAIPEALLAELADVRRTEGTCEGLSEAVEAAQAAGDLPVVIGDGSKRRHRDAAWAGYTVLVDVATAEFRGRYQVRQDRGPG